MRTPPSDTPPPRPGHMSVVTRDCTLCGRPSTLDVPIEGYTQWQAGELIQIALPGLTLDEREMLINGTHPECFDKIAGPVE